jgi:hypothetical protein
MIRPVLVLAALLLAMLAIIGCGAAPEPLATPIALMDTPTPAPTATPVPPPTSTPVPVEEEVIEEEAVEEEAVEEEAVEEEGAAEEEATEEEVPQDEPSADATTDEGIAGIWQVTDYAFGNVSAFGPEEAEVLLGETAFLAEDAMLLNITFGEENCRAALIDVQSVNADDYLLENYRTSAESIGVDGESLELFTTDCDAIPAFQSFLRSEDGATLILPVEGIFFFLVRDEPAGISPQTEPLEFAAGETSTTVDGAVIRGERMGYIVSAQAGQEMRIAISSLEENAVFTIFSPTGGVVPGTEEGNDITDFTFTLPESGEYIIVVGATRGNATYTLEVEISAL